MQSSSSCRVCYISEPFVLQSSLSRLRLRAPILYFYSTKSITPTVAPKRSLAATPALALNPPPSARPPHLEPPSRVPNQPAYKYYFAVGKTYANFYKTGFKNLWRNFNAAKAIAQRLESGTYEEGLRTGLISRADWHLVKRQRADLLRVPIFLLVFVVCGEFTRRSFRCSFFLFQIVP